MNQFEAVDEIVTIIPESRGDMAEVMKAHNAYAIIKVFTKHIRYLVETNNQIVYEKSVKLLDKIYQKGDNMLQSAVENVFLFSLDSIISSCVLNQRKVFMSKLPSNLYTIYVRQIYRSGI